MFDCTVAAMLPGFPEDLRKEVHEVVLRYGVYMLPVNASPRDFETWEDRVRLMGRLQWDLHSAFHEVARRDIERFSDNPRMPLHCLYANGEAERECMVEAAKEPPKQEALVCPKCHRQSGDSWSQCGGDCPMPMSPHFHPKE